MSTPTKTTGTVRWFNSAKGYGFIDGPDGDVMVHYRAIQMEGYKALSTGQTVEYIQVKSERGWQAEEVLPLEAETA